jgi:hypothetical protein
MWRSAFDSWYWPLHFSLVNTNVSDANKDLVNGDLTKGYLDCAANLRFLS